MSTDALEGTTPLTDDGSRDAEPVEIRGRGGGDVMTGRRILVNFVLLAVLFATNHGCVVACLSLATARLGNLGAWQSGVLYMSYTSSALVASSFVAQRLGGRNALLLAMCMYCVYVSCFLVATAVPPIQAPVALLGGVIGGVAASFLWTAQGAYFVLASKAYASASNVSSENATSFFGGVFAAIYLALEVVLRLLSTFLIEVFGASWLAIFASYAAIAVASTILMVTVHNYSEESSSSSSIETEGVSESLLQEQPPSEEPNESLCYKATAAGRLLLVEPKMKYMVFLNVVFGFAASFVTSFVNGEVVAAVMDDSQSAYVGFFTSVTSAVAATMSAVFGWAAQRIGKGPVLVMGAASFFFVAFPFVLQPVLSRWTFAGLLLIYSFQGLGRATFEGTLRATFADYFPQEKEAAFANIILQNGLSSAIGFLLTIRLPCSTEGRYCVKYRDGSLHNVLIFEIIIMASAILAIGGYLRAWFLYSREKEQNPPAVQPTEESVEPSDDAVMT